MTRRQGLIIAVQLSVLSVALAGTAITSRTSDWQPIELVCLLFVLAVGSEALTVQVRAVRMSGSFLALVLAMALLGPAPAAVIGMASVLIDELASRRSVVGAAGNLAIYGTFPLVGGLLMN